MNEIKVPFSVVKAGNAERYVKLKTELRDAENTLEILKEEYSETLKKFRDSFGEYTYGFSDGSVHCSIGYAWEAALVFEAHSKQLVDIGGNIQDAIARYKQAESDFNEVNAD